MLSFWIWGRIHNTCRGDVLEKIVSICTQMIVTVFLTVSNPYSEKELMRVATGI